MVQLCELVDLLLNELFHLEDIYYVLKYKLEADTDKVLSNDNGKTKLKIVIVPEDEVDQ